MIYVHRTGSLNRLEDEELDVKAAWKAISPTMIRRTDRFIQLSLLGAYNALDDTPLKKETALYMASGQGNLAVFKRLRDQRHIKKQPPKPVDFINSLSNTSGFYVAQYFEIEGKNLNVSRLGFVVENLLLLAQNDLELQKESAILVGGVDELQVPLEFTRKTLGICDERPLGEGSNWMLLSAEESGALASLEVIKEVMGLSELKTYLNTLESTVSLAFGQRMSESLKTELLDIEPKMRKTFDVHCGFYETSALYTLNRFVAKGSGELLFIDRYEDKYRAVRISIL